MKSSIFSNVVAMLGKHLGLAGEGQVETATIAVPKEGQSRARAASKRMRARARKLSLKLDERDIVLLVKGFRR